jgi:CRP/FNR family transcriptional regulator
MTSAGWLAHAVLAAELDEPATQALGALKPQLLKAKTIVFHPGMVPQGFPIVIDGRIGVHLTGRSGREMLLYTVSRGQTCVQSTLGLLGHEPYSAEAITETDVVAVMVPLAVFEQLMAVSPAFRSFVFRAFAARVSDMMFVLEQVAFVRVESRLAGVLLERADPDGQVAVTHQDLAVAIGSVREVVTRQLKAMVSRGLLSIERRHISIQDRPALVELAKNIG